jgi:hypothetical protein
MGGQEASAQDEQIRCRSRVRGSSIRGGSYRSWLGRPRTAGSSAAWSSTISIAWEERGQAGAERHRHRVDRGAGFRVARAGMMITAFAVGVVVGAPLIGNADLRLTLILALAVFTVGHVTVAFGS